MSAHLDTVPICVGSQPVRQGNIVRSANPRSGLGADNRAGCAVLLNAALALEVADLVADWREGYEKARAAVDAGEPGKLLDRLRRGSAP